MRSPKHAASRVVKDHVRETRVSSLNEVKGGYPGTPEQAAPALAAEKCEDKHMTDATKTTRKRVSNEQVMSAIERQAAAIEALISVLSSNAATAPTTAPATDKVIEPVMPTSATSDLEARFEKVYFNRVCENATGHAIKHGEPVVVYARTNKQGMWKLGYTLQSNANNLKDRGFKGFVKVLRPAA